jgi:2-succinyl-5-enolpyruvyl-6-hydroxy-3-cyclohexene-1-carboxylate synthase
MRISNKTSVQTILFHLQELGVKNIVYSPGSRNAPFAISLDGNPNFNVHVKVDERSAAFFALGIAQQTKMPVVLICTSGTAPLNYAPAIAEAFYQEVPLIVITADRPAESINQSEGQCIDQRGIYNNYIKYQCTLIEEATSDEDLVANNVFVGNAIALSHTFPRGPVHINVPFQEPLYLEASENIVSNKSKVAFSTTAIDLPQPTFDTKRQYLLLLGQNHDERLEAQIRYMAQLPNVWVMTETHSNLHGCGGIDCIDRWIMSLSKKQMEDLQWDVVVSLGHNIISRKIKTLIRQKVKEHWSIQWQEHPIDTYRKGPIVFRCSANEFMEAWLLEIAKSSFAFSTDAEQARPGMQQLNLNEYFDNRPFSDLKFFHALSHSWPKGAQIQMGNSSVVRYIQLFDQRRDLRFFGNRGVSGIDGSTSTAVGAAVVTSVPVILVTGDLSFLYDANGLWHQPWPKHLKIIVVDNGGGGIFKIIDGAKNEPAVPRFFETSHNRDILQWVKGWGLSAQVTHEPKHDDLRNFFNDEKMSVLVVKTPGDVNPIELDLFFEYFKQQNERVANN